MTPPRTFVIGDIHGCVTELYYLLDAIAPTSDDTVCFLGDYIDRGPSPKAVIDRLIQLQTEGPTCVFLKGNHEDRFLSYLGFPGNYGDVFLRGGGDRTVQDYGIAHHTPKTAASYLPEAHLQFFLNLRDAWCVDNFLCVHAGVRPSRSLHDQWSYDLFSIRKDFYPYPHPFPYTVLFGHTARQEVFLDFPYKIGLDTGVVYGNKLSCLELHEKSLLQIKYGQRQISHRNLQEVFTPTWANSLVARPYNDGKLKKKPPISRSYKSLWWHCEKSIRPQTGFFQRKVSKLVSFFTEKPCQNSPQGDLQKGEEAFRRGNYFNALREWEPLAEQGNVQAQYRLGCLHAKDPDGNMAKAASWFHRAAKQGLAEAQFELGHLLEKGQGLPKDEKTAAYWYQAAASQGIRGAQYSLALQYHEGRGVPQDDQKASFWYWASASQREMVTQT